MNKIAVSIGSTYGSPFGVSLGIGNLVSVILTNALVVAAVGTLFLFALGGFYIITGAGQQNPEKAAKGRQAATAAAIGFVIIFVSYWIIRLIEVVTGQNFITAPGF